MERATPEQRVLLRHAIEEGEQERLQEIVAIVRTTGALESTREAARTEARHASDCLQLLPCNKWTESLLEFAIQSVERHS
jgi:octaprenyl-diphosphate synthase